MNVFYKNLSILFLIMITSCATQKNNEEIKEVVFDAHTRGSSEKITIVNLNVSHKTDQETKTYVLSAEQRKAMEDIISKVKLAEISDLKAPSDKRFYDGAMTAIVSIKTGNKTFTSSSFDDDNPPEELKALVDLLKTFLEQ